MDREERINKARQFADLAHGVEVGRLSREYQEKLAESRNRLSARGILISGASVMETAKLNAQRITAMLESRLDLLLEGFELHHVDVDENLRDRLVAELGTLRSTWIHSTGMAFDHDNVLNQRLVQQSAYIQILEQNTGMHQNEVRTKIDRRRLMPKRTEPTSSVTIYHVQGDNNRWLTNSEDHSVNVIVQPSEQIFASLRKEIETKLPESGERQEILSRLTALEQAQNAPSFKQRYTEFISAAANHMALVAPFIPALTEMLQKVLG